MMREGGRDEGEGGKKGREGEMEESQRSGGKVRAEGEKEGERRK